jgi:hypothetical protein
MSHRPPKPFTYRFAACRLLAGLLAIPGIAPAQAVPGFEVTTYANVTDPVLLSFGPDGSLYVGRDPMASGSTTPVHVSRVAPGGSPVTSLGNAPISDPDSILLDVAGTISGVPGTLIVAGLLGTNSGRISGIQPNGTVVTLFDTGNWANVIEMKFDLNGRFLFTALESRSIWSSTGGAPTILATLPGSAYPTYLTIGSDNRIVVGGSDNVLRIYNADGSLANGGLATFSGLAGLEYSPGGAFGTDLYGIDSVAGTLVRVNSAGQKSTVGTGFATGFSTKDIAFSSSGSLYVSVNTSDKVLRIASPWENLGYALGGAQGLPQLLPLGVATGGAVTSFNLSQAQSASFGAIVLGVSRIDLPLYGGVLVPNPDLLLTYVTGVSGQAAVSFPWPVSMPSGIPIYGQAWTLDATALHGFSASNASRTTTQ